AVPAVARSNAPVTSEDDLRLALDGASGPALQVMVEGEVTLTGALKIEPHGNGPRDITLVGSEARAGRLRFPVAATGGRGTLAGLRVQGGRVVFKNLHLEVSGLPGTSVLREAAALVAVAGAAEVTFERCTFEQTGLPTDVPFIKDYRARGL